MQPFSLGPLSPRLFVVSTTTGNAVSPIVVTTTLPHSFVNGDIVTLSAVTGNTNANGTFVAQSVGASTVALYSTATGLATTGNGAYISGGQISAPMQLFFAKNDPNTSGKIAKLYFATAAANAKIVLVGLAGTNQATLAGVIREMNIATATGGRLDFYNLDGDNTNNTLNLTDYWVDCIAPATDVLNVTYWRA